jgi:hypothetical protein
MEETHPAFAASNENKLNIMSICAKQKQVYIKLGSEYICRLPAKQLTSLNLGKFYPATQLITRSYHNTLYRPRKLLLNLFDM